MVSKRRPRRSDRVLRLSKLSLENFIIDIRDLLEKPETQDSFKKVPFSYSFYERLQLTCILEAFFSFFGRRWNSCRFSIYKFLFKKSRPGRNSTTHRFRPGCPIFSQWRNFIVCFSGWSVLLLFCAPFSAYLSLFLTRMPDFFAMKKFI